MEKQEKNNIINIINNIYNMHIYTFEYIYTQTYLCYINGVYQTGTVHEVDVDCVSLLVYS